MNHLRRQKAGQEAAALVQGTGMIIRTRTIGEEVEVVAEVEVGVDLTVTSDVEGKEIIVVEAEAEAQALITETAVEVDTVMTAEVEAGLMTVPPLLHVALVPEEVCHPVERLVGQRLLMAVLLRVFHHVEGVLTLGAYRLVNLMLMSKRSNNIDGRILGFIYLLYLLSHCQQRYLNVSCYGQNML